eukprot:scaffold154963_cov37-Attheya_sp.AAC.1
MRLCGFSGSCLTLSEDHAYESHIVVREKNAASSSLSSSSSSQHVNPEEDGSSSSYYATCEIAIPGNTKQAKDKRGKEIEEHFKKGNKNTLLTPTTSWLYMRANPVICKSIPMTIAAAVGNINCTICEKMKHTTMSCSGPLLDLKRDMLWILHDAGHLSEFPFGLIELGDCEEHRPSPRGNEWVHAVPELLGEETVLMNEKLFHDAIFISRTKYNDSQTYPYFYAGHYHKDAGSSTTGASVDDPKEEYRLVEALRLYASASRVASQYTYDSKDSLQLLKHMTAVASLIDKDILSSSTALGDETVCSSRQWYSNENALAAATWLLAFFDSLLVWEEKAGQAFVELLKPGNKNKHGWKLFQHFSPTIRSEMVARMTQEETEQQHKEDTNNDDDDDMLCSAICITSQQLFYFTNPRSKRLTQQDGLLLKALGKTKISIHEMELTILQHSGDDGGRRKRAKRER